MGGKGEEKGSRKEPREGREHSVTEPPAGANGHITSLHPHHSPARAVTVPTLQRRTRTQRGEASCPGGRACAWSPRRVRRQGGRAAPTPQNRRRRRRPRPSAPPATRTHRGGASKNLLPGGAATPPGTPRVALGPYPAPHPCMTPPPPAPLLPRRPPGPRRPAAQAQAAGRRRGVSPLPAPVEAGAGGTAGGRGPAGRPRATHASNLLFILSPPPSPLPHGVTSAPPGLPPPPPSLGPGHFRLRAAQRNVCALVRCGAGIPGRRLRAAARRLRGGCLGPRRTSEGAPRLHTPTPRGAAAPSWTRSSPARGCFLLGPGHAPSGRRVARTGPPVSGAGRSRPRGVFRLADLCGGAKELIAPPEAVGDVERPTPGDTVSAKLTGTPDGPARLGASASRIRSLCSGDTGAARTGVKDANLLLVEPPSQHPCAWGRRLLPAPPPPRCPIVRS